MSKRHEKSWRRTALLVVGGVCVAAAIGTGIYIANHKQSSSPATPHPTTQQRTPMTKETSPAPTPESAPTSPTYPQHTNIMASMFYVGEPANEDNGYIQNRDSTWDEEWMEHYGGIDTPNARNGWRPAAFTPKENPFYVALPYNDLDDNGNRKPSAKKVYWFNQAKDGGLRFVLVQNVRMDNMKMPVHLVKMMLTTFLATRSLVILKV